MERAWNISETTACALETLGVFYFIRSGQETHNLQIELTSSTSSTLCGQRPFYITSPSPCRETINSKPSSPKKLSPHQRTEWIRLQNCHVMCQKRANRKLAKTILSYVFFHSLGTPIVQRICLLRKRSRSRSIVFIDDSTLE